MAAGFPGGTFVGNPGTKGGPNVQPFFGGGGGAYGGGKGGYQLGGGYAPPRRRFIQPPPEEVAAASAPVPPAPGAAYMPSPGPSFHTNPLYINPYAGIPGFDDYRHQLLRIRGDVVGKPGTMNYAAARGFPDRDRVTQISNAMQRLGMMPPPAPHTMGTGGLLGDQADAIRRLLKERHYGGD